MAGDSIGNVHKIRESEAYLSRVFEYSIGNLAYVSRVVESSKYYQCYKCTFKVINMVNEIGVAG